MSAPAPSDAPAACYGLACPQRGTCERFSALGIADGAVIDSCQTREGWPMYRPSAGPPIEEPRPAVRYIREPLLICGARGLRWCVRADRSVTGRHD